jgi:hypothetical protein
MAKEQDLLRSPFKSETGPGQNGDARASSSYTAGKTKSVPLGDWQTRELKRSGTTSDPIHHASKNVNANPATVPGAVDRRKD